MWAADARVFQETVWMAVRTEIAKGYLGRLALIGLFCLGLSGWSLYDGMIGWPQQREEALLFQKFYKPGDSKEQYEQWQAEAAKRGWPNDKNPGEPKDENDFFGQYVMAGITAPIGLGFLGMLLLRFGGWIEADEKGLRTNRGREFSYDQITVLDKKKWKNKGIAKLHYQDEGREKKLTLDDYNYQRDPTQTILRMVEDHIDHSKIINGQPEPPPKPADEEPAAEA